MPVITLPDIDEEQEAQKKNPGGPWIVILWDDNEHTYDYVIEMLMEVCSMTEDQAFQHAIEVDTEKKTVVFTGELEHAEFIQERILGYGPDPRMPDSKGSMTATLEQR
jgi:ATP-dependent Clp protease adaptor protein ClpS